MTSEERARRALRVGHDEQRQQVTDARGRAHSLRQEMAHDRDLIQQFPEYRMAREAEVLTRKIQERGRGR
jgi:hypothetical protein